MKKVLAVILCLLAVCSVMTVVATTVSANAVAVQAPQGNAPPPSTNPPPPSTTAAPTTTRVTTTQPTDDRSFSERLLDWWNGFFPALTFLWDGGFALFSNFLVFAMNLLLRVVGLR